MSSLRPFKPPHFMAILVLWHCPFKCWDAMFHRIHSAEDVDGDNLVNYKNNVSGPSQVGGGGGCMFTVSGCKIIKIILVAVQMWARDHPFLQYLSNFQTKYEISQTPRLAVHLQSAQMKLSSSKIVIASFLFVPSSCGFFCWIAMCLQMYRTIFHHPRWKLSSWHYLINRTKSENISFNLPCLR